MGTKNVEKQLEIILSKFPMKFSEEVTLDLLNNNIDVCYIEKMKCRKYKLNLIDNEGYKYLADYNNILNTIGKIRNPNRFFYNNPYTYENINWFCERNNINMRVEGHGLPLVGYAREKLDMIDSCGNINRISWNQLQHYTFQYKENYEDVKRNKFDESHMTKEKAKQIIYDKYNELKRPLLQRDFQGIETTDSSIGIRVIWRIWGTFTNMVSDLGLPEHDYYYKPYDKNYKPHSEIINSIKIVCDKVKESGRATVMYSDFYKYANISEVSTVRRHCNLDGLDLNDVIKLYGCKMQRSGNGFNYTFSDGEKVVSKYEYDFSKFLRDNGLVYNKDYFRNIYYKKLDSEYNGNMNCDYYITFNGMNTYIELAGILGNKEHQEAYKNNSVIKSKSKEEYRRKLNLKRGIFERNHLKYFILLKDDMNEDNYKRIMSKYLKEVA